MTNWPTHNLPFLLGTYVYSINRKHITKRKWAKQGVLRNIFSLRSWYLCCFWMGHLGQNGLISELENGVTLCCDEECCEKETVTTSIQYAVKVLLMGLGEDINREGIRKTPLRVAKALSEGTRGHYSFF